MSNPDLRLFADLLEARRTELVQSASLRTIIPFEARAGSRLARTGEGSIDLSSNDYLGLASEPWLRQALVEAARTTHGPGASRLVTGTTQAHVRAEQALADFVRLPASRLLPSGYQANVAALQAVLGPGDVVFSDALNHASLIDGCRLSRARVVVYPHRDVDALAELVDLHRGEHQGALVVTDAVFSMDGDVAPLAELRALADRHGMGLFVDEAHALGVLGGEGRGACAEAGVVPDLLTGMLGKAFGHSGGFVAGSATLASLVDARGRAFVYSTAMHPLLAAVVPALVEWVRAADDRRHALRTHVAYLAQRLGLAGSRSGILPWVVGANEVALAMAEGALAAGVVARAIRPPTVPPGTARLRLVPTAAHSLAELDRVAEVLLEVRRRCESS